MPVVAAAVEELAVTVLDGVHVRPDGDGLSGVLLPVEGVEPAVLGVQFQGGILPQK